MRIRLTKTLPVYQEHGMKQGRVFEVLSTLGGRFGGYWVISMAGQKVLVHRRECEVLEEDQECDRVTGE